MVLEKWAHPDTPVSGCLSQFVPSSAPLSVRKPGVAPGPSEMLSQTYMHNKQAFCPLCAPNVYPHTAHNVPEKELLYLCFPKTLLHHILQAAAAAGQQWLCVCINAAPNSSGLPIMCTFTLQPDGMCTNHLLHKAAGQKRHPAACCRLNITPSSVQFFSELLILV